TYRLIPGPVGYAHGPAIFSSGWARTQNASSRATMRVMVYRPAASAREILSAASYQTSTAPMSWACWTRVSYRTCPPSCLVSKTKALTEVTVARSMSRWKCSSDPAAPAPTRIPRIVDGLITCSNGAPDHLASTVVSPALVRTIGPARDASTSKPPSAPVVVMDSPKATETPGMGRPPPSTTRPVATTGGSVVVVVDDVMVVVLGVVALVLAVSTTGSAWQPARTATTASPARRRTRVRSPAWRPWRRRRTAPGGCREWRIR